MPASFAKFTALLTARVTALSTERHRPTLRKFGLPLLGAALLLLALVVALSWGKDLDERHRPLDSSEAFDFSSGSFDDYIAWAQRRLRTARPDASDYVMSGLLPFRLEPAADCAASESFRNGVVLTHDLFDSPYTMRELGIYFQQRCFLVFGLLLPGHGSRPGDLLRAGWQDWDAAQRFAVREISREIDNLYLAGHGVGGTLAILEAARNAEVDGLMLFAPMLAERPVPWRAAFGVAVPAARWDRVMPAYSDYRYESHPYRATGQVNALVEAVTTALPSRPFEVPVFMVASMEDATADTPAILAYMKERVHPLSHTLLYSREPLAAQPGITVHPSHFPELGLLSFGHLGLTVPMHDSEFGWYGTSHDCGHYFRENAAAWQACMAGERSVVGEVLPGLLAEGLLERITFNPAFETMTQSLDTFIAPVAPVPAPLIF